MTTEDFNILKLDPDNMPPNDQKVYTVALEIAQLFMTDPRLRMAILQGHKADATIYLHRGVVSRNPMVVFHSH